MDKTFEEIINEELVSSGVIDDKGSVISDETSEPEIDEEEVETSEPEIDEDEKIIDNQNANYVNDEDVDDITDDGVVTPTNEKDYKAFAEMRTTNKDLKSKVDFFDMKAKAMGYSGVDELMQKTQEAELNKQAQEKGIPVDVLKRLEELEADKKAREELDKNILEQQRQDVLGNTIGNFIDENKLSNEQISTLGENMSKDGIMVESLLDLPESTVKRILKSYLPDEVTVQKELEKKEKIKKELPINSNNSQIPSTATDELDKIAKMFAGK